jgi:hypothetical protein
MKVCTVTITPTTSASSLLNSNILFYFIHFWSVTLVNTIKTTSFTPSSVIKLQNILLAKVKFYINIKQEIKLYFSIFYV